MVYGAVVDALYQLQLQAEASFVAQLWLGSSLGSHGSVRDISSLTSHTWLDISSNWALLLYSSTLLRPLGRPSHSLTLEFNSISTHAVAKQADSV